VGNKIYGGQATHLPLNVNAAGVIPIIFAQSILMFPNTIVSFFAKDAAWGQTLINLFRPTGPLYVTIYGLLIVFFAYFYTAMVINPEEIANNMQKYGGFVPGVRPGKRTAEYIDHVMVSSGIYRPCYGKNHTSGSHILYFYRHFAYLYNELDTF